MSKDLERLLTYCPATDKKADQMLNQGNKLIGYIFEDGKNYRTCAYGSVRNSITQKEWEGLTFPNKPSYEQLEQQNKALRELVEFIECDYDRCTNFKHIKNNYIAMHHTLKEIRNKLKEIGGE